MSTRGSRILVTGASGFVGRTLVGRLLEVGYMPVAVFRERPAGLPADVEALQLDLTDAAAYRQLPKNIDQVVHLAANVFDCVDVSCFVTNVWGTYQVAHWARRLSVRVIYASTSGVYAETETNQRVTEESELGPRNMYHISKLLGEEAMRLQCPDSLILRLSYLYGHGDMRGIVTRIAHEVLDSKEVHIADHGRDLVHVEDAADAIISALTYSGSEHIFNISNSSATELSLVAKFIVNFLRTTVPIRLGRHRPSVVVDNAKARRELKWHPQTALEDGLSDFLHAELSQHPARH